MSTSIFKITKYIEHVLHGEHVIHKNWKFIRGVIKENILCIKLIVLKRYNGQKNGFRLQNYISVVMNILTLTL